MEGYNSQLDLSHRTRLLRTCFLWAVLMCLFAPNLYAAPKVHVVLSSEKDYYRETASFTKDIFQKNHPSGTLITSIANQDNWPAADSQLVVAVGSDACKAALEKVQTTALLCTFLPRSAYEGYLTRLSVKDSSEAATAQRSAIYFDQPLARYMALIRTLVPEATSLGTAVGPLSRQLLPDIQALANKQGLTLHTVELQRDDNPVAALSAVVEKSDVFLVNPDSANRNKVVANWLLRLSIRQRIPVIAYSRNYVNAGALAAVYSSPENIGRDTGETISHWLKDSSKRLEPPRYTNYFTVSSNPRVARALGIKLPQNEQLQLKINQLLGSPPSGAEP